MKVFNEEIAYAVLAKVWYDCRYSELKEKQRKAIKLWWEDNSELAYKLWMKGHKIFKKK